MSLAHELQPEGLVGTRAVIGAQEHPFPNLRFFWSMGPFYSMALSLYGRRAFQHKARPEPPRLIMNMIPSNALQRLMPGDLATLSSTSAWVGAHLHPNQVLLWSVEDQQGAHYAWAVPPAWRKFLAFRLLAYQISQKRTLQRRWSLWVG